MGSRTCCRSPSPGQTVVRRHALAPPDAKGNGVVTIPSFAMHDLGWHAFQQLCHTVLREVLGQEVLSFLDNNDRGRDGAFAGTWSPLPSSPVAGEFVAQCKHTAKPGANIGPSDLAEEFDKAEQLVKAGRCDVYLLMTNAGISGGSETKIVQELKSRSVKHVLVLGSTWLNQTIAESSRLRRLVPRLYGLGDLTQILDDRAYRQARAVLDAMRSDLDKLVLTGTYQRAADALASNSFVLLVGAPATGKTTIAAQLALGAADEFDTAVVKIDSIADLQDRWNPDDRQLFWLDDAFGATQFDRSLARAWTMGGLRVSAAIEAGSMFVLTCRDYIFRASYSYLKPGSFPLFNEAQVVVDVADLTLTERSQILYNHLRHGSQPNSFLETLLPNLEVAAGHPGFTPELARRLADPAFTGRLMPATEESVSGFFGRPSEFLRDVMAGLDTDAQAALGLVFVHHDWLPSPVSVSPQDEDLLTRLGSNLGGVTKSFDALRGSLVQHIVRNGASGWVFSHPTMVDAYADLLRSPELLHHLLVGFPLDVLLREITCGDVGVQGAVIVPTASYEAVLDRLDEPYPKGDEGWRARDRRTTFLSTRCDSPFLRMWLDRDSERLAGLAEPGLMLEADADNELVARLNELGLFPEEMRSAFAAELVGYCLSGEDPAVLWNERLASILIPAERAVLLQRVRSEMLGNLRSAIYNCTEHWPRDHSPESAVEPLRSLAYYLPRTFPGDAQVATKAKELDQLVDEWVADQEWSEPSNERRSRTAGATAATANTVGATTDRSVFDDLLDGRPS